MRALRKGNALGKFRARVSSESPMGHQKSLGNFCFRGFFDIHFTTELPPAPQGADVRALRKGNALGEFRARVSSESPMGHQKALETFLRCS